MHFGKYIPCPFAFGIPRHVLIKPLSRYVDFNKSSPEDEHKPFLAIYPMRDMGFTLSEEFKGINVKSDILPGSGVVYDLADMDVSYLGLKGTTKKKEGNRGESFTNPIFILYDRRRF
jgi:hypothetical protein